MTRFLTLPNGTRISAMAVQLVEARALMAPWIDHAGRAWPAMVFVETRHQLVRCPCASLAEAMELRETLAAAIEAAFALRLARQQPPAQPPIPLPILPQPLAPVAVTPAATIPVRARPDGTGLPAGLGLGVVTSP